MRQNKEYCNDSMLLSMNGSNQRASNVVFPVHYRLLIRPIKDQSTYNTVTIFKKWITKNDNISFMLFFNGFMHHFR